MDTRKGGDETVDSDVTYELEEKYRSLSLEKKIVRSKLRAAQEYSGSLGGYEVELGEQALRLRSIGLYKSLSASSICPICESEHAEITDSESIISNSITELNAKLEGVSRSKPRVITYLNDLLDEDRRLADGIKKTRNTIEAIREQEIDIEIKAQLDDRKSRVVGRFALYLESINWDEDTTSLREKSDRSTLKFKNWKKS